MSPVKSADGSALACVFLSQTGTVATVSVLIVDAASGATSAHGNLSLPNVPIGSYVLGTPAFAPDGSALALVLSISVPTATQTITKQDPATGQPSPIQAVTRVSHHELAYFSPTTASFAGPFDLADGPSLTGLRPSPTRRASGGP